LEKVMLARIKQSWGRGGVFAAAILATTALSMGVAPRPAEAQFYGYGHSPYAHPYHGGYSRHDYHHHRDNGWHSGRYGWQGGRNGNGRNHAADHHAPADRAPNRGAVAQGSGNAYMGWLGAHGSYR
jgi:hypothetical protein